MRKVLIITTRDLPEIPINKKEGLYSLILSDNLGRYIKEHNNVMPENIGEYLRTFDENTGCVKKSVTDNLKKYVEQNKNNCQIPILKRTVCDDFLIYVTLCLSKEFSGFGDEICHGYISAIINDVKEVEKDAEYYLLAHSMDIVRETNSKGLSRQVSIDELKNDDLKNQIKHVNIFCHEDSDTYYKGIITHLLDKNININLLKVLNA